ncbi:hypothetical protein ACLMAL_29525 [Nocardia sp. CWNU-33]|uniref:hypothetical protein n=1 Tax=Nocardia sp. CWNU-33 TaxID=3392117 RepID=UPI00398EC373
MSKQFDENELATLTERYVAMWNESDAENRSKMIRELWAIDGVQVLVDPPQEIREAAAAIAFPIPAMEVRGHDALDRRVTRAYEMFVAAGEHIFAASGQATQLSVNLVGITWLMVSQADGSVVGGGYDVLALDEDGRIQSDHQHIGVA